MFTTFRLRAVSLSFALALTSAACGGDPAPKPAPATPAPGIPPTPEPPPPPADPVPPAPAVLEGPFVPIARDAAETAARRLGEAQPARSDDSQRPNDFYLAINKKELGQRWFLSAYIAQSDGDLHARSLGTTVVSFKVQNGKLFVFRAESGLELSNLIAPELIIEAYPIVKGARSFEGIGNASDYVLFDPAAGLNRFTVLGDTPLRLTDPIVFSQNFRAISDGVTFEQVFAGAVPQTGGRLPLRLSGTLTFGLRRYAEGEGFTSMPLPRVPFYFDSDPRIVKDAGTEAAFALKWNIGPDKPAVKWVISDLAEQLRQQPRLAEFDIAAAIKSGVESWNAAFGFPALEARVAAHDESYGRDDVNVFVFDSLRAAGSAFANLRHNPNTGEIRGASVYFPIGRIDRDIPPVGVEVQPPPTIADANAPLVWGDLAPQHVCDLATLSLDQLLARADEAPARGMTRKEFVERYIAQISAHEVGHTLGLRHNFKGSLRQPSTSVMDYLLLGERIENGGTPGSYDTAAIHHLYGFKPTPPAEPFCTDEHVNLDPDCRGYDGGSNPLVDYWKGFHGAVADLLLSGRAPESFAPALDEIVPHVRNARNPADRALAYDIAVAPVRQTVSATVRPDRRDFVTRELFTRLFINPLVTRMPAPPPLTAPKKLEEPVLTPATTDLKAFLINADGTRGMPVRRFAADLLKKLQHATAAQALIDAKAAIEAQLPALTGNPALETRDLLARIDRHLGGYFD